MKRFSLTLVLVATMVALAFPAMASQTGKVNINTATAEQLQLLPRVGPSLAKRIVDFRSSNGTFTQPEEWMLVKGVGEKSFELLKPYLSISGETTLSEKVKVPRKKG
mgnify:FL=1